ncbi:hypothetical protein OROMI_023485 [Orobanche minor]
MAIILEYYHHILLIPLFTTLCLMIYLLLTKNPKKALVPTNWPIVGMLPSIIRNSHRIHDFLTEVLNESGGTFEFKGPVFSNMNMVFTCDPANINHIFTKRFSNYPKGPEFKKIFDILGDGIFRADNELWELQRRTTLALMTGENFYASLQNIIWRKTENGLLPILDRFWEDGADFDMQDIFGRFSFDTICQLLLNHDPCSLSPDLPYVACEQALNYVMGPLLHRHLVPESYWKLQKWLKIGREKKLIEAWRAFDDFIYPHVFSHEENNNVIDMFGSFKSAYGESKIDFSREVKDFLRDTFLNLLVAGRDSMSTGLTWFFWLMARHPSVEIKIQDEIENVLGIKRDHAKANWRFFNVDECEGLIYLHAALSETLRLFPPIPIEHKVAIEPDFLPGGKCYVDKNKKVIISFYSTGRMESVWGKDCLEFKPERWIETDGVIKHEPSFKFPAFNVGPRTCIGKKMAIVEMKMVAAFIVHHFHVRVVENHPVSPRDAIILKAKHGLRVRLTKK